jgi:hypothetical protein
MPASGRAMSGSPFFSRGLGWMRIGIGVLILLRTTPLLAPLDIPWLRTASPLLGWPEGGFGLAFLSATTIRVLAVVRTFSAVLFTLGVGARAAGLVCGAAGFLIAAQYPLGFFFTIHLLYQAAMLLACTDAVSQVALVPPRTDEPAGGVWLIRAFVASIYFWAGIFKLRPDWLDGRVLALFHHPGAISGWLADAVWSVPFLPPLLAKVVAVIELGLGPLLLWAKTRRPALALAYGFHGLLEITAHPDMLGWGMMVLLLAFVTETERANVAAAA